MAVHLSNGLLPVIVILWWLAYLFDSQVLAKTAFINQVFVIISLPFVIYTGVIEWRKKYDFAQTLLFKIKVAAAALTTILSVISLVWYLLDPGVILSSSPWRFLSLQMVLLAAASTAGHIGRKLVFKD